MKKAYYTHLTKTNHIHLIKLKKADYIYSVSSLKHAEQNHILFMDDYM